MVAIFCAASNECEKTGEICVHAFGCMNIMEQKLGACGPGSALISGWWGFSLKTPDL